MSHLSIFLFLLISLQTLTYVVGRPVEPKRPLDILFREVPEDREQEEDREDRCTGSYRQAVGLFPILVSVIW